ncbi:twin-arginine translocase subunit TatB [Sphingomonas sp. AP4-R1]|nr:twin-arginine translocase subunit TatB [Sphingomonas sp. AP4-R1]
MFDIAPSELMLVAIVALVVIGPKDLPRAMRVVGQWVGRARGVARHFRSGFDEMIRQAEMEEMEKKWAAENARIMAEHPASAPPPPEEHDDAHYAMMPLPELPEPVYPQQGHDGHEGGETKPESDGAAKAPTESHQEPPARS